MFGLFNRSNNPFEPLDYEGRKYFENNLLWLHQEFPEPSIDKRKVFTPSDEDFPIGWNNSENNAIDALNIIAENMQIQQSELELKFFDNGLKEINAGSTTLFLETAPDIKEAAGTYHKKKNGKYTISLDKSLLSRPEGLIATIAHELAHVKLLGHKNLEFNDEELTDMTTVFYGFGIFSANSAFQFYKGLDRWGYSSIGYLKQEDWAYVLALFSFLRCEESPTWSRFLTKTTKKDFDKCLKYTRDNEEEIFRFNDSDE